MLLVRGRRLHSGARAFPACLGLHEEAPRGGAGAPAAPPAARRGAAGGWHRGTCCASASSGHRQGVCRVPAHPEPPQRPPSCTPAPLRRRRWAPRWAAPTRSSPSSPCCRCLPSSSAPPTGEHAVRVRARVRFCVLPAACAGAGACRCGAGQAGAGGAARRPHCRQAARAVSLAPAPCLPPSNHARGVPAAPRRAMRRASSVRRRPVHPCWL